MDQGVMVFAQVMAVVMGSIAALVGIGLGTRVLWRLGSQPPRRAAPALADSEELQRLQTAIDAIAIEVERISEGQRFTVSLLSNRLPPPSTERNSTPPSSETAARVDSPV